MFINFIFLSLYSYIFYPLILLLLTIIKKKSVFKNSYFPYVSLIIAAYNEETVIGKKIENALALDYPKDKLEVIVVSDCSTDRTNEIVKQYKDKGVILNAQQQRMGKTAGLNDTLPKAKGEIVVFSDANAMYPKNALKNITKNFADPKIGFVTGSTKYISKCGDKVVNTTGAYARMERFIKKLESALGSCVGADGAIFAIRKTLYQPLKNTDINDFVIPLGIVQQGYRGIMDEEIFCIEETAQDIGGEFKRQTRITNRTLRAIFENKELLNPFKFPLFSFQLISHKLIRFLVPFFLVLILALNSFLLTSGLLYQFLFFAQFIFYACAILGYLLIKLKDKHIHPFSLCYHFILINTAILLGWIRYLSGRSDKVWEPERA